MPKIKVIAECGINHNGSFDLAIELVNVAKGSGADFAKFQIFDPKYLVSDSAPLADYQKEIGGKHKTQYELLQNCMLGYKKFEALAQHCNSVGIEFLATPFDDRSLEFLLDLNCSIIKISSGDLTNGPFLLKCAQSQRKIILSTGMGNLAEVKQALAVLQFGYTNPRDRLPSSFAEIAEISENLNFQQLKSKVTILHCTSNYPASPKSLNLNVLKSFKKLFNLNYGYSDHTRGIHFAVAAAAMGATVIEKHLTLDKNLEGPDHQASIEKENFAEMVNNLRELEDAFGSHDKKISPSELNTASVARRGIYAARSIEKGKVFEFNDLNFLRPNAKTSPMHFWDLIGKRSHKKYEEGEPI